MQKPKFADPEEKTLDCEDWIEWIRHANPRTRVDAYPLFLVWKELLDRFARRELTFISRRTGELEQALVKAQVAQQAQELELEALRFRMSKVRGSVFSRRIFSLHPAQNFTKQTF